MSLNRLHQPANGVEENAAICVIAKVFYFLDEWDALCLIINILLEVAIAELLRLVNFVRILNLKLRSSL